MSAAVDQEEEDAVSVVAEPETFWEKEEVANQVAKFDAGGKGDAGQAMPMLVAVRVRPLWNKVRR